MTLSIFEEVFGFFCGYFGESGGTGIVKGQFFKSIFHGLFSLLYARESPLSLKLVSTVKGV